MIYRDCRDCKNFEGDCGNHFRDSNRHINYFIADEMYYYTVSGDHASCFEPSDEFRKEKDYAKSKEIFKKYTTKQIKMALELFDKDVLDSDNIQPY